MVHQPPLNREKPIIGVHIVVMFVLSVILANCHMMSIVYSRVATCNLDRKTR